ncbi:Origin recognition complex subunit 3 [Madurella fahalii]|uniref:Origin recognition complex subunit 3 n=1 Tax=Madurella fahalii TaxID=1157608 RepID=A0ABQ0G0W1_9PEZI
MEQPPSPQQPNNSNSNNSPTTPETTTAAAAAAAEAAATATAATTTFSTRLAAKNPALHRKLTQMSLKLAPLVQLTTGAVHPDFPRSLLGFWLLTEGQLDALAHFYHQRTPCRWTGHYPCPVSWPPGLTLEEKRRKLGKFIGLRGCDTPLADLVGEEVARGMARSEEEIVDEARRARRDPRTNEVEEVRRKMGWY